jgi:hypothetical protein
MENWVLTSRGRDTFHQYSGYQKTYYPKQQPEEKYFSMMKPGSYSSDYCFEFTKSYLRPEKKK